MPNMFNVVDWLAPEGLRILLNGLVVAEVFNTSYNKEFKREFAPGETTRVPLPQRFFVTPGLGYQPQALDKPYTTVTMDQIFGVHFQWDSAEKLLQMPKGEERIKADILEPAMAELRQEIDSRAALWAHHNTNNIVGILGTDPTTPAIAGAARRRMIENACPPGDNKRAIMSPSAMQAVVDGGTTVFNPTSEISRQYKEGSVGKARGFDWYESMSIYSHTAGTWAGAVTVNGAGQSGTALTITATAGDTFKVGDVISIAAMYNVNPKTRRSTGVLKQLVVTQDLTAAGGGVDVLNIQCGSGSTAGIVGPGSHYQNVDALPADTAALTLFPGTNAPNGKSGINSLALHPDAFALVSGELEVPQKAEQSSYMRDPKTGIALRFVRAWNQQTSQMQSRFDVMLGFGNLYSDSCSVRMLGA